MTLFKNKYRIESNRLAGWNYANAGIYFITLVIQHRACILGRVTDGIMHLSDFGQIVDAEFYRSFSLREELILHEYILMPNHLHVLVEMVSVDLPIVPLYPVETQGPASLRDIMEQPKNYGIAIRQPKSISTFVAGFKSGTTNKIDDYIDENHLEWPKYNRQNKLWQPNYHDHIVRDKQSYWRIRNYIKYNPQKWRNDCFNNAD